MKFSLFLGCFIPVRLPHIEKVARSVLGDIGIELKDIGGFTCCPEPVGFYINDRLTATAIAARNIALAEELGTDIITLCNGCTYVLKQVNEKLKLDSEIREKINDILAETDLEYRGKINVKHFAQVLNEDIGLDRLMKRVERPLTGLSVACHTGCHILSPPEIMKFDNPSDPIVLDKMVAALGAEPTDFSLKTICCGWTLTNYGERQYANQLIGAKLRAMTIAGSNCISVICPQCFYQFDTGQIMATRSLKLDLKLPVLFYLQLLALSMGYSLDEIHYGQHRVKNPRFEEKLGGILA